MSKFNYLTTIMQKLSNTWGTLWCLKGCADIDWSNYKPTEAWMDTTKFIFTKTLRYGQRSDDVKELQKVLGVIQTGYFGAMTFLALKKFQIEHGLKSDGVAGPRTNSVLNAL